MKCPSCGNEVGDQSRFCSSCGASFVPSEQKPAVERQAPNRLLIGTMAVIALIMIVAGVFAMLRPRGGPSVVQSRPPVPKPTSSLTQTPVPPDRPSQSLTQTEVPPAPPSTKAPPEEKAPPEVADYINFVKAVEARRCEMRDDFGPALEAFAGYIEAMADPDENAKPEAVMAKSYSRYVQDWSALVRTFHSRTAPEPCRRLGGVYGQALGAYAATMTRIQGALIQSDYKAARAIKTQQDINALLRQADQELTQVTTRYKLEKTFTITPDTGVPGLDLLLGR